MQIRKFTNVKQLKPRWNELYERNPALTPFQSYEWNLLMQTKFTHPLNWIIRILLGKVKIEYWTFTENENKVIAPIIINSIKNKIYFFGQQEDFSDYLSFIFNENTTEEFLTRCILALKKKYFQYIFIFDRVNESNIKMKNACINVSAHIQKKKCVKIVVTDQLISKVKSDSRRYWKQAIKRIETDSLIMDFSFNQIAIEENELRYLLDHYFNRKTNKNNYSYSKQFLLKSFQFLHNITGNKNDMVSLFCTNNKETFIAKCLINNRLAAYMNCISRGETLYVLRISIDDNFNKYRPGILLIVETVDFIFKNNHSIKFLDFSRGDDSYKLNYGGSIHHNYCFTMN